MIKVLFFQKRDMNMNEKIIKVIPNNFQTSVNVVKHGTQAIDVKDLLTVFSGKPIEVSSCGFEKHLVISNPVFSG